MLTGARLREILPVYLSAAGAAILSALPRVADNPYVIPSEKEGQPRADLKRPWDA